MMMIMMMMMMWDNASTKGGYDVVLLSRNS